ncbi:MAG: class A sortase [Lysinibacillus sp.]
MHKIPSSIKTGLLICVLIVGLLLVFINPIQSFFVARMSERLNTTEYTAEDMDKNNAADANFEFDAVQSLSIAEVLKAQASIGSLPVIGSIVMPSVGMQLPIIKGVGNAALAAGAGTMKPNQTLGEGNYALAGHYFEEKDILFGPLYHAEVGDAIYLTDKTKIYVYHLMSKDIIEATDVFVINDVPGQAILTLITCAEEGHKRLSVQAEFVESYPVSEAPEELSKKVGKKN